jgi:hypothetical protein
MLIRELKDELIDIMKPFTNKANAKLIDLNELIFLPKEYFREIPLINKTISELCKEYLKITY